MKADHRKPPLAKSPMRLRTQRALRPTNTNTPLRTPIIGSMKKTQMKQSTIRPELSTFTSSELKALAKMVQDELGAMNSQIAPPTNLISGSLSEFERGRFYDEYAARRNARLMKKQKNHQGENAQPNINNNINNNNNDDDDESGNYNHNVGVIVESAKKRDLKKKSETVKKSVIAATPANYSVDRSQQPRYSLRSAARKPPLPVAMAGPMDGEVTAVKKTRARRK